jgi:glycosyltransferase 2 family protein
MNNKLVVLLKLIVSIGLISILISKVVFSEVFDLFSNVDLVMILLSFALIFIQVFVASLRWQFVLKYQKIVLNFRNTIQILWAGLFFNQAMPSAVGGDVVRGYYLKEQGVTLVRASLGVLMDRLFGLLGLIFLVLISLPILFKLVDNQIAQSSVLLILISVSFALFCAFFTDFLPKFFLNFRIIKFFNSLSLEARQCIIRFPSGIIILALSLVIHLISVVAVITIAIGLGLNINWGGFLIIVPIAGLMMIIPISIAGWGVREGVMVVGFSYLGVTTEAALAISILYGLVMLIVALPGGFLWLVKGTIISTKNKS